MSDLGHLGGLAGSGADDVATTTAARWAALHGAARVVAALAGVAPALDADDFAAHFRALHGWRKGLAETAVDDLAAVMEPGIAALLAVNARGLSPVASAQALWREFVTARAAIFALVDAEA